ncbi:MAG: 50S ribosomal protein L29 [Candidatus Dadabacteria bacterium]|nr:MAG: 50S ribosomal protein L29 [Candidatus Dadabacteria bacterium]
MSAKELRELTDAELEAREQELRQELFNLRFQHALRQLENTARIRQVKREIARILTVLRERRGALASG